MSSPFHLGRNTEDILGGNPRFFYGIRRNDDGELFLVRIDMLLGKESVELNIPGSTGEDFPDFENAVDFFEGITELHEPEYDNLYWTQYRWDSRGMLYYINEQGQLVQRVGQNYEYTDGISS
jgi:hypothetical protein